jgi:asparagine synthase (glutamine-hydrolysing)
MSDVPYGVLLSGVRFFITSAVAKNMRKKRIESGDVADAWYPQLPQFRRFSRFAAAQIVADHIGRFTTKLNSLFKKV